MSKRMKKSVLASPAYYVFYDEANTDEALLQQVLSIAENGNRYSVVYGEKSD